MRGRVGRLVVQRIIRRTGEGYQGKSSGLQWLDVLADVVVESTETCGAGLPDSFQALVRSSVENMKSEIRSRHDSPDELTVADIGDFVSGNDRVRLMTVHASKGREFDAVAIVHVNDGRFPHFAAETHEDIEDSRRALYVAVTRARKLLMVFSDTEDWRNRPSPFLREMGLCD